MMAPDLTLALHAATYHAGIPTHSSSHATIVGPFHRANGVPAFMASSKSSCRENMLKEEMVFDCIKIDGLIDRGNLGMGTVD